MIRKLIFLILAIFVACCGYCQDTTTKGAGAGTLVTFTDPTSINGLIFYTIGTTGAHEVLGCNDTAEDLDDVLCWEDQSSSGLSLLNGDGSAEPAYYTAEGSAASGWDVVKCANNDYLRVANASSTVLDFDGQDQRSFISVFRTQVLPANQDIISRYQAAPEYTGWRFHLQSGKVSYRLFQDISTSKWMGVSGSTVLATNTNYYTILTYSGGDSGSNVKIWVNGNDETENIDQDTLDATYSSTADLSLCRAPGGSGFIGEFALLGIYNIALTADDVSNLNTWMSDTFGF